MNSTFITLNIPAILNIQKISVYNRVKFKHVFVLPKSFVFVCLDPGVKGGGGTISTNQFFSIYSVWIFKASYHESKGK